ncbi:hypothetical protein HPB48_011018 [Haemaphysalis longicornis]|uniref:Uncharacterized protein n=1 Tax=Haemaphysalis longicornis TaxID=44386 RepID=A0A9J6FWF0_HAELO|nr:hypothetical protein HPB48_011018 [Haemaphysalis longicornis]
MTTRAAPARPPVLLAPRDPSEPGPSGLHHGTTVDLVAAGDSDDSDCVVVPAQPGAPVVIELSSSDDEGGAGPSRVSAGPGAPPGRSLCGGASSTESGSDYEEPRLQARPLQRRSLAPAEAAGALWWHRAEEAAPEGRAPGEAVGRRVTPSIGAAEGVKFPAGVAATVTDWRLGRGRPRNLWPCGRHPVVCSVAGSTQEAAEVVSKLLADCSAQDAGGLAGLQGSSPSFAGGERCSTACHRCVHALAASVTLTLSCRLLIAWSPSLEENKRRPADQSSFVVVECLLCGMVFGRARHDADSVAEHCSRGMGDQIAFGRCHTRPLR